MAREITLVSTTDSAEDVQAALTGKPAEPTPPAEPAKPVETPVPPAAAAAVTTPPADPAKPAEPAKADEKPTEAVARAQEASKSARARREERIQSDIDKLVAMRGEERRGVEMLQAEKTRIDAEIAAKKAELAALGTPAAAAPSTATATTASTFTEPKPKLEDKNADGSPRFANYEEWVEGLNEWSERKIVAANAALEAKLKRELTEAQAKTSGEVAAREDFETAAAAYKAKIDEFKKTTPDFDAVWSASVDAIKEIREELGPTSLNAIDQFAMRDADNGPAIIYHLAQHPDEMKRIASLALPQQLAALGRLDQRLSRATPEPARVTPPPVTKAPEPITPVGGAPTASTASPDDESYAEYKRRRDLEDPQTRGWAQKLYANA